jgi:hypothetical protein
VTALQFIAAATSERPPADFAFEYSATWLPGHDDMLKAMKGLPPAEYAYVSAVYNWLLTLNSGEAERIARKCGVPH